MSISVQTNQRQRPTMMGVLLCGILLVPIASEATILWDYSPDTTGAPAVELFYSNGPASVPGNQNWLESFTIQNETLLTGMSIFEETWPPGPNRIVVGISVTIKIARNVAGAPGPIIHKINEFIDSIDSTFTTSLGSERVHASLSTPLRLGAGTYWIGMSSTFESMGQVGLLNVEDNKMAQLNGDTFSGFHGGGQGDMAFQLEGTAVPIPAAFWLFCSAIGCIGILRRRAT